MKKLVLMSLLMFVSITFAQTKMATLENGEKAILKDNKTWEYLNQDDALENTQTRIAILEDGKEVFLKKNFNWAYVNSNNGSLSNKSSCVPKGDFKEPRWAATKIRTRNKTRVDDLKRYAVKDTGVAIELIILLESVDTAANGKYVLCVDGVKKKYKRNGAVFNKNE